VVSIEIYKQSVSPKKRFCEVLESLPGV